MSDCTHRVADNGRSVGHHDCCNKALPGRNKCRIHTPEYMAAKADARQAKWAALPRP